LRDALDGLVDREIETVTRGDRLEQLNFISKKFNLDIDLKDQAVKDLVELTERRNLLTHNAGKVNEQYLGNCRDAGITVDCKLGDRLSVDRAYYKAAVVTATEVLVKTCVFTWRKLVPEELNQAMSRLNFLGYRLVQKTEYDLARRLLHFGVYHCPSGTDEVRRMMIVNYANALKLSGDVAGALKVVDAHDWTASSLKFVVSVAAVRDDIGAVIKLMEQASKTGDLGLAEFRTWPVFRPMRSNAEFRTAFKRIFGKDIIDDTVADADDDMDASTAASGESATANGTLH
jgi:hypothetical protein